MVIVLNESLPKRTTIPLYPIQDYLSFSTQPDNFKDYLQLISCGLLPRMQLTQMKFRPRRYHSWHNSKSENGPSSTDLATATKKIENILKLMYKTYGLKTLFQDLNGFFFLFFQVFLMNF